MSLLMQKLMSRVMAPVDGDGADAGNSDADARGDNFRPTGPDALDDDQETVDPEKTEEPVVDETPKDEDKVEDDKKEDEKGDKPGPKKTRMVPETRLSETVRKAKDREEALKAQITQMTKAAEANITTENLTKTEEKIEDLEEKLDGLLKDGKDAEAKQVRMEIRRLNRVVVNAAAEEAASKAQIKAVEEMRYEATITRLETQYPVLNEDHEDFDADIAGEVMSLRNSLARDRQNPITPAKALERAVAYVTKANGIKPLGEEDPTDKSKRREEEARRKAAAADKAQPTSMGKAGIDSDKAGGKMTATQVSRMTQDQFAKLDEETLSKLRGDTL